MHEPNLAHVVVLRSKSGMARLMTVEDLDPDKSGLPVSPEMDRMRAYFGQEPEDDLNEVASW